MYSKEIKDLLKLKRNLIDIKEYLSILNSPQIDHIKYENDWFKIWTNDGYEFKFKLVNR